jgi:tRNA 2-thiouridine synthesizing protein A
MSQYITEELDLKGLNCPMPLLKTKLALNRLASGAVVQVASTDPSSERDFVAFAKQSGTKLLESWVEEGVYYYRLQKA